MGNSLNQQILAGYFWNLASKWVSRSIGLISTLILIRILEPEDFGVAALATIVTSLFTMLSEAGTDKYLIKAQECNDEMLNSAWSLNIALKALCSLIVIMLATPLSRYTNEPVLENVLLVSALIPLVGAFKNVGLVNFEREMNYKPLTQLTVLIKILVFPITIFLAVWLKNYWALVVGVLSSEILMVIGSYLWHPYRPRWGVKQWSNQWSFSKWMLLTKTSGFVRSRVDAFLLGRFLLSHEVGTYRVSQEFAWLPFSELISPATRSLYAGISKISHNRDALHDKIIAYQTVAYLLVVPSVFGIYALQDQIVDVLMGEQWKSAAPIVGLLSLLMFSMPLNAALQNVLMSLSKVKYLFFIDVLMVATIAGGFYLAHNMQIQNLMLFTQLRVGLVVLFISLLLLAYKLVIGLSVTRLMTVMLIPTLPGIMMFLVLESTEGLLNFSGLVNLVLLVSIGASVFIPLLVTTLWVGKKFSFDCSCAYTIVIFTIRFITGKFLRKQ